MRKHKEQDFQSVKCKFLKHSHCMELPTDKSTDDDDDGNNGHISEIGVDTDLCVVQSSESDEDDDNDVDEDCGSLTQATYVQLR